MQSAVSRLMIAAAMLFIVAAAFGLKTAGFQHAELDALLAAGPASVVTVIMSS